MPWFEMRKQTTAVITMKGHLRSVVRLPLLTLDARGMQYQHEIDDIVSHGTRWAEEKLSAIPGMIPKAEAAKKKQ